MTYSAPAIHTVPQNEEPLFHQGNMGAYDRVHDLQEKYDEMYREIKPSVGEKYSRRMFMICAWCRMSRYRTSSRSQTSKNTKGPPALKTILRCMWGRCPPMPMIIRSLSITFKTIWPIPHWSGTWTWTVQKFELSMTCVRPLCSNTNSMWTWLRTEVIFRLWLKKTMRHSESMLNGGGTSLPKSAHM